VSHIIRPRRLPRATALRILVIAIAILAEKYITLAFGSHEDGHVARFFSFQPVHPSSHRLLPLLSTPLPNHP
jgi:hypothetical protein